MICCIVVCYAMLSTLALLVPESINLCFLSIGVYGMFKSIEIQHPLYAALFLNLLAAWATSAVNLLVFPFIDFYVGFSNSLNVFALHFHIGCWLVTSIIRYVYLIHRDWVYSKIPSVRTQCYVSVALEIIVAWILLTPIVGAMLYLGKYFIFFSFRLSLHIPPYLDNAVEQHSFK